LEASLALDVVGHVLGHLNDGSTVAAIDHRKGGNAEDLPVCERDLGLTRVVSHRSRDDTIGVAVGTETDVITRGTPKRRHIPTEVIGERTIAAQKRAAAVEHGDRVGNRVERLLPIALPAANEIVQAGVLDRDPDLAGNDSEKPLICGLESSGDFG